MEDLRLILLLVGAAVVGAIYLRGSARRDRHADDELDYELEDRVDDPLLDDFDGPRVRRREPHEPELGRLDALGGPGSPDAKRGEDVAMERDSGPHPDPRPGAGRAAGASAAPVPPVVSPERAAPGGVREPGLGAGPGNGPGSDPGDGLGAEQPLVSDAAAGVDDATDLVDDGVIDVDDLDAITASRPDEGELPAPVEPVSGPQRPPDAAPAASAAHEPDAPSARAPASDLVPDPAPDSGSASVSDAALVCDPIVPRRVVGDPDIGSLEALERASEPGPRQLDLTGIGASARGTAPGRREPSVESPAEGGAEPDLVIVLTVMARRGSHLAGPAVKAALEHVGLVHGEMHIYHRHAVGHAAGSPPVFSVANVQNPGSLDPDSLSTLATPGLAFFMRAPGPIEPASAFQQMLEAGRRVAERLDALLCDETRSTMTNQSINHLRERIAEHARRRLIAGRR